MLLYLQPPELCEVIFCHSQKRKKRKQVLAPKGLSYCGGKRPEPTKVVFPRELLDRRTLHTITQLQLRIVLPFSSYQKMKAAPGRTLLTSFRQTIGSHLLRDLFTSFRVPMS